MIYRQNLQDIDISILINNVGTAQVGSLLEIGDQRVHDLLTTNTFSMVGLTRPIIQSFKKRYLRFG